MKYTSSGALESAGGVYRYSLRRHWSNVIEPSKRAMFVMLNPSTANCEMDDPTIRRCVGFAQSLGYDGLVVGNLYALRATNPQDLFAEPIAEPVGLDNDEYLKTMADLSNVIIAGWGVIPRESQLRVNQVCKLLADRDIYCLGKTKNGSPRHPLYLKKSAGLEIWRTHEI